MSTEARRHKFWRFVDYVRPYWKYLLLAVADRILVLSAGTVVESGTHHESLANGGLYREYHRRQFASAEVN